MNWRYIMNRVLAAVLISLIIGFIHKAHAGVITLTGSDYQPSRPATFTYDNNVWQYNPKQGTSTIVGNDVTVMDDFKIPTSKGRVPMTIEQKAPIDNARVAAALGNFVKNRLPLVGTAVGIYVLVCELTNICKKSTSPDSAPETQISIPSHDPDPVNGYFVPYGYPFEEPYIQTSVQGVCDYLSTNPSFPYHQNGSFQDCVDARGNHAQVTQINSCNAGYYRSGNSCLPIETTTRDLVEADWPTAIAKLNLPENQSRASTTLLDNKDLPFPTQAPSVSSTTTKPIDTTTETVRDSTGTATGTKTSTTTAKVEPPPAGSPPSTATYTETTVTTVTDITNNTTNTTTTTTSPPDDVKKDPDIEIDNVSDVDLPTHDVENTFQPQSFGEGSCPPDPQVSYSKGSLTLPFHIACDYASMIRAIVLILASLTAAYIIAGTKYD